VNIEAGVGGTRFFDGQKRFRGCAALVTKRSRAQSDLTVLDVVGADAGLTAFLAELVRSSLVVQESDDTLFNFQWASGFVNGKDIKIQGILDRG
jgi:hypothetical protein